MFTVSVHIEPQDICLTGGGILLRGGGGGILCGVLCAAAYSFLRVRPCG